MHSKYYSLYSGSASLWWAPLGGKIALGNIIVKVVEQDFLQFHARLPVVVLDTEDLIVFV